MEKNSTKANKDLRKNARALYKAGLVTKEEKKKLKKFLKKLVLKEIEKIQKKAKNLIAMQLIKN